MEPLNGLRIAIYARFSSDNQKDASIDDQVRLCRTHVERQGGTVDPALIITDYAVSGASSARAGFERLLRLVEKKDVDAVVTESGDRFSRDLGDSDRLWKLCTFHRVRLVCVSDGIDSANEGSRLPYCFKAILADEYLNDLGKKTLRGLRGAAERGHSTGGLPFGYTSKPIWGTKREPEGHEILVDAEKAEIVVRIFELYRDGYSFLSIATTLNDEGIPPPRASSGRSAPFWRKSTIREMLRNEMYIGWRTFGERQWKKAPGTNKRRYRKRPAHEVHREERPELRIVRQDLWDAVTDRRTQVGQNYSGSGGGAAGRRTHHPFTGLLYCGVCGARMVDGGGSLVHYYRCSKAATGGICENRLPVREDVLIAAAVTELRRVMCETSLYEEIRRRVEERLANFRFEADHECKTIQRELDRLVADEGRLVAFIRSTDMTASPGAFDSVRRSLEEVAKKKRAVEMRLASAKAGAKAEPRVPTVDEIVAMVLDVEARIKEDPTAAREAMRQLLGDGRIDLHPQPDGGYRAESVIFPLRLPPVGRRRNASKPREPLGSAGAPEVVGNDGCAGRI